LNGLCNQKVNSGLTDSTSRFKAAPMNYRHAFHAGNHGDVLKHVVLTRVLSYMTAKDSPLAVLDAHAGIGRYDLTGIEAIKTGEWRGGIGALLQAEHGVEVSSLLKPYLDIVRGLNPDGALRCYPGSPEVANLLLRPTDRLLLNELHPEDYETLAARYAGRLNVKVSSVDAIAAVKAALPFHERRGVVLIDPAFEVTHETEKVALMLKQGLRRMAQTCFIIWYPVTTQRFADALCDSLTFEHAKSALRAELLVRPAAEEGGLAGSGVVVVNPPWTLYDELQVLLLALTQSLQEKQGGTSTLRWLLSPA
jgi:23S rRNA (adenine2030-N6)-methyltransferase